MEQLLVTDVAKVILKNKATGRLVGTSTVSTNSITSSLNQELLRAGWGGGVVAILNSEKTVELNFEDLLFSMEYLAIQQGTEVEENASGKVLSTFAATVKDNAGALEVAIPEYVTATSVIMEDLDGTQDPVTVTGGKVTLPVGSEAVAGDTLTFFYEETITGQKVTIDAENFPKMYECVLHTRAFDPKNNVIVKDIYIQFDKVQPNGASELSLGVSTNAPTTMTFTALNGDGTTEMGRYWAVDRV